MAESQLAFSEQRCNVAHLAFSHGGAQV
eukprot:COSAG06_NODE_30284_length_541_cov_1.203620_1_plen_27_part_01